jgi:hypothetical protein
MDKKEIAANLARELRELATLVIQAGEGDVRAKSLVGSYVDGYWNAIVLGNTDSTSVQALLDNEDEDGESNNEESDE